MRLSDIKTILHAEVLWGEEHLDREVFSACGSDFMSDAGLCQELGAAAHRPGQPPGGAHRRYGGDEMYCLCAG